MGMLDRLREEAIEEDESFFGTELEDVVADTGAAKEQRILGMNAVERMMLAVLIFLATSVVGTLLLIALGRIDIGL